MHLNVYANMHCKDGGRRVRLLVNQHLRMVIGCTREVFWQNSQCVGHLLQDRASRMPAGAEEGALAD